jgi:hypothetical protein
MMRALLIVVGLLAALWSHPSQAQNVNNNCFNPDGSGLTQWFPCFLNNPSPLASTGQYAVSLTSVTTLTVPATALIAEICVEGAAARYTTSGTTPNSTTGIPATATASAPFCFQLAGLVTLQQFKIIGAGATMDVEYFR